MLVCIALAEQVLVDQLLHQAVISGEAAEMLIAQEIGARIADAGNQVIAVV